MKRLLVTVTSLVISVLAFAQNKTDQLSEAFQQFENDAQLKSGLASLYVIDATTGNVVFAKNGMVGLAPASTQKIITSASAYELLGKDFRYKTEFGYKGEIVGKTLKGDLYIKPSGDPTLGSWRWNSTKEETTMGRITEAVKKAGISGYKGLSISNDGWQSEAIPDGWVWQDIGNYYGAGAAGFNWRENQFDIVLASDNKIGSAVKIVETVPVLYTFSVSSLAKAAAKGTGDNAYVYYTLSTGGPSVWEARPVVRGTIPVGEKRFVISASNPHPSFEFLSLLSKKLAGINVVRFDSVPSGPIKFFHIETSPPLDSIIFWFNRKSINLYGEALVKTIAYQKKGIGATNEGVDMVKDYWKSKGIPTTELNIVDGSGLSPLNRVTTHAQVAILHYAKKQPWFAGYFLSLPEFNGMKMKSGTIRGVKGFCGYHTSKSGGDYIFSFLVNNYNGSSSSLVQKMYKLLDVLK